jgi:hypothetical protein
MNDQMEERHDDASAHSKTVEHGRPSWTDIAIFLFHVIKPSCSSPPPYKLRLDVDTAIPRIATPTSHRELFGVA